MQLCYDGGVIVIKPNNSLFYIYIFIVLVRYLNGITMSEKKKEKTVYTTKVCARGRHLILLPDFPCIPEELFFN